MAIVLGEEWDFIRRKVSLIELYCKYKESMRMGSGRAA